MCGIAGYVGKGDQGTLEKMMESLKHRGPDDRGFFIRKNVGFAHTRLSIIDVSPAGHQPMFSADGSVMISFNGEIYNYQELKDEFLTGGQYAFRGSSDTEVILCLYQKYGEEVFSKLNGMFAIALYDFRQKKLFLARDRMGKKPLYYGIMGGTIFFASELKALRHHPLFSPELNLRAVNKYLLYEYVPTPDSIYENVYKLEPATFLCFAGGKATKKVFWRVQFQNIKLPLEDAVAQLDEKLNHSVTLRLISDVPLGIFLSGGIDSSTIAYYAQKNTGTKIKTFSIGFQEDSFDESHYAQQVAEFLGTEHHEQVLTARDSLDLIPRIAEFLDEPLADASIIPTYLLSQFTRKHVTVALGGDGGDELFAGYPTFQAHRLAAWYSKIPLAVRRGVIEKIIQKLPVRDSNMSFDFLAKKFVKGLDTAPQYVYQHWLGSFSREDRSKLFKPEIWQKLLHHNELEDIDRYYDEVTATRFDDKLLHLYLRTYMMDDILVKVDRASMAHALEVRAPFLDFHVVDFVNDLPMKYKLKGLSTKYILKRLMKNKLPPNIVYRKKKGFGIPLARWLRNELKPLCMELLSRDTIESTGLFNYDYVEKLKDDHMRRVKDNRKPLWTLMVFQMWCQIWKDQT